jgi:hypothetical protein
VGEWENKFKRGILKALALPFSPAIGFLASVRVLLMF